MLNIKNRADFIEAITPEFNRAWRGITENGVRSYDLYIGEDGDLEAMAEPVAYDGARFGSLDAEMIGEWEEAAEYLEFYADDLYAAYKEAL